MTTKIKWCIFKNNPIVEGWKDLAMFGPEPVEIYKQKKGRYKVCPAFQKALDDYYVIKSPVDIEFTWTEDDKRLNIKKGHQQILERDGDRGEDDNKLMTFFFQYVFVADKPTMMEVFSPLFENKPLNWHVLPGKYDICSWVRPVDITIELKEKEGKFEVKRGEPLMYIKFYSENFYEEFEFEQVAMHEKIYEQVNACTGLKDHLRNVKLIDLKKMFDSSIIKKIYKWF